MFNFFFKKVAPIKKNEDDNIDESICIICLSPLKDKPTIYLENCLHQFHIECINEWIKIKPNCPNCRSKQDNTKLLFLEMVRRNREKTILQVLKNLLSRRNNTVSLIV